MRPSANPTYAYACMIPHWRQAGYVVKLIFLSVPDVEMVLARVAARVAQGSHAVTDATIRRRFTHGIENFHHNYQALVDTWLLYDNAVNPPALLAEGGLR